MSDKKPRSIVVLGRRWFQRTNGNTYHSVNVYVDGALIDRVPFTYGYGSHFEQTACDVLCKHGYLPSHTYPLAPYCREHNIECVVDVANVSRKKDL